MTTFLPKGYKSLKTEKAYWKMSHMKDGDNRLRIVMQPIAGWLDWHELRPMRYRPDERPSKSFNPDKPIKPFWACYVWDYARDGLYILEITQSSLLKALTVIAEDEDWGDFTKYDIKINKEGIGKETRYSLTPLPHKPLSPKTEEALRRSPVRLEALYESADPWTDLEEDCESVNETEIMSSPFETLQELLEVDEIDISGLEEYLNFLSISKKKKQSEIIESALIPDLLPKFKAAYIKDLQNRRSAKES